ncbi:MAG: transporter substrate-binding domain-containing protein, partial [Clostridia bacterium]
MPKRFFSLFVVCFLLFSAFSLSVNADNDRFVECRTVKIGYFEFPGYQEISETGEKSGYGYEYLQELRKYANWKYEYVYADYGKCLELLKNGEIDLLTSVSYSDAREEIYDYSAASMGTKDTIMTVKSTNSKYIPGEYNSFDGIHIGMLKENTNDKNLEKFSKLHEFSYTKDDSFADIDSLKQALQTGEIDAIITSNLRIIENETIIAEFSPSPYYAIVKGGNKELLYELNNAMEKINIITPTYQTTLYQKYYGSTHVGSISFSSDELEYIKNNPKLTILVPPSLCPMAYVENGKVKGIEPDLIRKALEPSGFIIDFITFDSADEYIKVREQTDKYPVLALVNDNLYNAEISDVRLTSPYVNITYTIVTKVGAPKDNIIVAAVKKEPLVLNYVEKHYKPEQIRYYDNGNECIEAILNGQATHTVMNSYIAEHIIENDLQNRLVSSAIMGFSTNFSISVHNSTDYSLF